jgi:5'-phosphate synthase pdxT subunit
MSDTTHTKTIGILALQGDYDAHRKMLSDKLKAPTQYVRTEEELAGVDALVLPGGESTAIIKLMNRVGLDEAIKARINAGMPVFGTCAGMILLARHIHERPDQPTLGAMNITVARNAFGRQIDSFEADIPFQPLQTPGSEADTDKSAGEVRGVFIRAPYVMETAPDVRVLSHFRDKIVSVQQGALLATAFHPELTDDPRVHAYFLQIVAKSKAKR